LAEIIGGRAILPETLRWLWRDYPGVKSEGIVDSSPETVTGEWDVETIIWDIESLLSGCF
jgi:hypothetical protein